MTRNTFEELKRNYSDGDITHDIAPRLLGSTIEFKVKREKRRKKKNADGERNGRETRKIFSSCSLSFFSLPLFFRVSRCLSEQHTFPGTIITDSTTTTTTSLVLYHCQQFSRPKNPPSSYVSRAKLSLWFPARVSMLGCACGVCRVRASAAHPRDNTMRREICG